jgi:anti-sigma-K factor RskA
MGQVGLLGVKGKQLINNARASERASERERNARQLCLDWRLELLDLTDQEGLLFLERFVL